MLLLVYQRVNIQLESCKFAAAPRKLVSFGNTWIQRCRMVGKPGFL